jgi:hypothetical protein
MKSYFINILFILLAVSAGPAYSQVRVSATVEVSTEIYPGNTFYYSIIIEGGARPQNIDTSPIEKYNPGRPGTESISQFINGRASQMYKINYPITAQKPGTMKFEPVKVIIDGKEYTTNPVEITVATPGTTDKLRAELILSDDKCYLGQPIVMTIQWYIMAPVREAAFNIPVFTSDDFYVEDIADDDAAYSQQQIMIHNVPVTLRQEQKQINGVETAVISLQKVLIPKRTGLIKLEPVTISADMAVGRIRSNDIFGTIVNRYERFSVDSKAVELEVLPLPETSKPEHFYGLVGRYTISAQATPVQVNVGDPITFTIKIGGNRYLKPVQWPQLTQIPEMADNFKIPTEYASPKIENGQKIFTQTIRALSDKVESIPSIPLAIFDPDQGKYSVIKTEPIKLQVAPTQVLTGADLEGVDFTVANREVEAIKKGLSANYETPDALINQSFSPLAAVVSPGYMMIWGLPFLALVTSSIFKVVTATSPQKVTRKIKRRAYGKAVNNIKRISSADSAQSYELLSSALKQYIGERFEKTAGSLTADDCRNIILNTASDNQLADGYAQILSDCDHARYASYESEVTAETIDRALNILKALQRKIS